MSAETNTERQILLGSDVRDCVTGFKGVLVARLEHLFHPPEVQVQPRELDENGLPRQAIWFEETRIEAVSG